MKFKSLSSNYVLSSSFEEMVTCTESDGSEKGNLEAEGGMYYVWFTVHRFTAHPGRGNVISDVTPRDNCRLCQESEPPILFPVTLQRQQRFCYDEEKIGGSDLGKHDGRVWE